MRWRGTGAIVPAAVFLVTLLAFVPVLDNDFVDWDDLATIRDNPHIRGLRGEHFRWAFDTYYWGHYQPLVWLSYMWDYVWGGAVFARQPDPRAFHLTSVLLHALNAGLVCALVRRIGGPRMDAGPNGAAIGAAALFWSLHPLRVEAVAWATGRGDVLVTTFLLLAVLTWLGAQGAGGRRYAAALVIASLWYLAALLTRATAVMLPPVLLIAAIYPLRLIGGAAGGRPARARRVGLELVGAAVVAAPFALWATAAKSAAGATLTLAEHGVLERMFVAAHGLAFYAYKTVWPLALSPIYELRLPVAVSAVHLLACMAGVLVTAGVLLASRTRWPGLAAALACYAVLLFPTLGLTQAGNQFAADRYSYLATVPLTLAVGAAVARCTLRATPVRRRLVLVSSAAVLVGLTAFTRRQIRVWRDTAALWTHAAAVAPDSSIAQNGRGWVLAQAGKTDAALDHFRRAIMLRPTNEQAHVNLWHTLRAAGRDAELLHAYRASTQTYPTLYAAQAGLAELLAQRGDTEGAIAAYQAALNLRAGSVPALTELARLYWKRSDWSAAEQLYRQASAVEPANLAIRRNLVRLLLDAGQRAAAAAELRAALEIDPHDGATQALRSKLGL